MSVRLTHTARLTLLVLALVALLLVGLSTLERTGSSPVTPLPGVELVKKSSTEKPPQTQKHCTDSKGKDAEKSPACQSS